MQRFHPWQASEEGEKKNEEKRPQNSIVDVHREGTPVGNLISHNSPFSFSRVRIFGLFAELRDVLATPPTLG